MRSRPEAFDAVVSADTLVYFGALEDTFSAVRCALRPSGTFVFTLESSPADAASDYRLELHGRYAHCESYVRKALSAAGFELESLSVQTLREERARAVAGYLVVARAGWLEVSGVVRIDRYPEAGRLDRSQAGYLAPGFRCASSQPSTSSYHCTLFAGFSTQ